MVEKSEVVEARLVDAELGAQPEVALEWAGERTALFEDVGEGPEAHHLHLSVALADGVGHPRTHVRRVGHLRFIHVAGIELRPEQGQTGHGRGADLVVNLLHGAAHHLVARDRFMRAKHVFGLVVSVDVRRNEVHGNLVLRAVTDKGVGPGRLGRGGAADAQARAYCLKGARDVIVKLEVSGLFRIARPKIEIRLVPNFKVPLRDLIDAVAVDEVLGELGDEIVPLIPVFGWRDVLLVPESMKRVLVRGQCFGHETQFDERTHPVVQQAVVDLIDIRKVVQRMALGILVVDSNFIVEDGVEAHVLEAGNLLYIAEIVAIALAQRHDGALGAKHVLPEMGERMGGGGGVDDYLPMILQGVRYLCRSQWS